MRNCAFCHLNHVEASHRVKVDALHCLDLYSDLGRLKIFLVLRRVSLGSRGPSCDNTAFPLGVEPCDN